MDIHDLFNMQNTVDILEILKRLTPEDREKWRERCIADFPQTAGFVNALYRAATKEGEQS